MGVETDTKRVTQVADPQNQAVSESRRRGRGLGQATFLKARSTKGPSPIGADPTLRTRGRASVPGHIPTTRNVRATTVGGPDKARHPFAPPQSVG
jgi:hypothetical protein